MRHIVSIDDFVGFDVEVTYASSSRDNKRLSFFFNGNDYYWCVYSGKEVAREFSSLADAIEFYNDIGY